ncbi:MAG: FkbM family methyltransferase [Candidatus Sericytochromatia bacterium]|nr:FkbM family methyltransferase [Candidatus Sericytochromatia bacterium]
MSTRLREDLLRLLGEADADVRRRESGSLEEAVGGLDRPFVLFGAGHLGKKVLNVLRRLGHRPLAFIDNNPALAGTSIEGIDVYTPAAFVAQHDPAHVGVITTIWSGEATDRMRDRIGPLKQLGFRNVALFGHMAWAFKEAFLPYYALDLPSRVLREKDRILAAFDLMSDEASRQIFVEHVRWRLWLDYDRLPEPCSEEIYFNTKYVNVVPDEVVYDIGAFDGDTAAAFVNGIRGRAFSHVYCFEPMTSNYEALVARLRGDGDRFAQVSAHRLALGDERRSISVESSGGPAARVGAGQDSVEMTTVDDFASHHKAPSFLKLDIEGFEQRCLSGARATIERLQPVIAVCVYHLQAHLWDIPLQIQGVRGGYRFHLLPHVVDGWDLVLYAVPQGRAV